MSLRRLLILLGTAAFASAWDHFGEQEFVRAVGGHNQALIAFVEPTIAASEALESEWTSISETEKILGSVDCTSQAKLCSEHDIISYPTIRYFDGHGGTTPYRGPRKASAIVSFLRRVSRPPVTALDDKKITAFQSIDDAVVIAYINPRDSHLEAGFKSISSRYRDRASFGSLETTDDSTLVCYNNRDNEQSSTSDLTTIETLPAFVANCMKPLVGEFSRRNELKYLQSGNSLVYYLANTQEEREGYINLIRPLAKKYKAFLSFVTVDVDEYASMAAALGLQHRSLPALAVQNPARGQVFPFLEEAITPEAVDAFVQNIASGMVQPWVPLPIPEPASYSHDELHDEL